MRGAVEAIEKVAGKEGINYLVCRFFSLQLVSTVDC